MLMKHSLFLHFNNGPILFLKIISIITYNLMKMKIETMLVWIAQILISENFEGDEDPAEPEAREHY